MDKVINSKLIRRWYIELTLKNNRGNSFYEVSINERIGGIFYTDRTATYGIDEELKAKSAFDRYCRKINNKVALI